MKSARGSAEEDPALALTAIAAFNKVPRRNEGTVRIEEDLSRWLSERGFGEVESTQPIAGGDINEAYRLSTASGESFFLKRHANPPRGMFPAEARGLAAMRAAFVDADPRNALRIPEVHLAREAFLLLEDLPAAPKREGFWEQLGRGLATLHACHGPAFGFFERDERGGTVQLDNYCGLTPQPNPRTEDGYAFFAEHRLLYQARLAATRNRLSKSDVHHVAELCERLPEWIPPQPPSLIHGDLWSGNVHTGAGGEPALIDPAAHWGWPEAEIAMTRLFGGFPRAFYDAYCATHPLDDGWEERLELYNLYHVLNHVNLFGGSYVGQARAILHRFA